MPKSADDRATSAELRRAGYWFGPRKGRFSWGWTPISWQGWLLVAILIASAVPIEWSGRTERQDALYALPVLAVAIGLCVAKGTRPGPSRRSDEQLREIARRFRDQ